MRDKLEETGVDVSKLLSKDEYLLSFLHQIPVSFSAFSFSFVFISGARIRELVVT